MSARGTFVAVVLAGVLGANRGWACDEAAHARAAQAERDHQLREAIDQRTDLLRCAGGARAVDNLFALASDHAALRNALRAAEFGERAAEQAPTDPRAVAAMTVAAGYRLARGELPRAEFDVHWLLAAGSSTEAASTRALEVGAALEQARQWSAAVYWYDWLLTQFTSPEQESVWQRALSGLYRAVDGRGVAGVRGVEPQITWSRLGGSESVAEARFRVAMQAVDGCARLAEILASEPRTGRRSWDSWRMRRYGPWLARQRTCGRAATRLLNEIVALHDPRWEAAARRAIGALWTRLARTVRARQVPPEIRRNPELLDAYGQIR